MKLKIAQTCRIGDFVALSSMCTLIKYRADRKPPCIGIAITPLIRGRFATEHGEGKWCMTEMTAEELKEVRDLHFSGKRR